MSPAAMWATVQRETHEELEMKKIKKIVKGTNKAKPTKRPCNPMFQF